MKLLPCSALALFPWLSLLQAQGPGGLGGPGGPMNQPELKILAQFDADQNGYLDAGERQAARVWLQTNRPAATRGGRGPGFPGGPPGAAQSRRVDPNARGTTVDRSQVPQYADWALFDPDIVRTIFLDFAAAQDLPAANAAAERKSDDWYAELQAFYRTDVMVPATATIDGRTYPGVGTGFRGNTSYLMVQGKKKSWNLDFGYVDSEQKLQQTRNLDLLNCNDDPSLVREALHGWIANQYLPAQRVAFVRLVVNGEDFGIYAAVQQFDKAFLDDHFGTKKGDRWKVAVDFAGNGGLRYLGDERSAYERNYLLKSADNDRAWSGLIDLCAVLAHTAAEDLPRILPQHLDIDGALWFLAVDNALGDDDGYFSRASDYVLYRDPKGRFHAIARDNNEILKAQVGRGPGGTPPPGAGGPGAGEPGAGGPGRRGPGGGTARSPLDGAERKDRPLLHRLLEVPAWRARYLGYLRILANSALAEATLAPRLDAWSKLLQGYVAIDAHALYGAEAFAASFARDADGRPAPGSLLAIAAQRRRQILDDPSMQGSWPALAGLTTSSQRDAHGNTVLHLHCQATGVTEGAVWLHYDQGPFGAMATLAMHDDGQHGDGKAGDGHYAASLPPLEPGKQWRYWIEAIAADADAEKHGRVTCLPLAGGGKPLVFAAPKPKARN